MSRAVLTDFVRTTLGFTGLLVADDLTMGGVTRYLTPPEAIERTFAAGMDVLSVCHDPVVQTLQFDHLLARIRQDEALAERLAESTARVRAFRVGIAALGGNSSPEWEADGALGAESPTTMVADDAQDASRESFRLRPSDAADRRTHDERFMIDLSTRAIRLVKSDGIPKARPKLVVAPRLSRQVMVEDPQAGVPFAAERLADALKISLTAYDRENTDARWSEIIAACRGKRVVLFSENAHLDAGVTSLIERIVAAAAAHTLVALRNPYDADIPGVRNAVVTYGYARSQQQALVGYLGRFFEEHPD